MSDVIPFHVVRLSLAEPLHPAGHVFNGFLGFPQFTIHLVDPLPEARVFQSDGLVTGRACDVTVRLEIFDCFSD